VISISRSPSILVCISEPMCLVSDRLPPQVQGIAKRGGLHCGNCTGVGSFGFRRSVCDGRARIGLVLQFPQFSPAVMFGDL
jgi:hypothetical protein